MKKSVFLCLLTGYILICCTVTSLWVEKQMTLIGRVSALRNNGGPFAMEIPLWQSWPEGDRYHVFCVETVEDSDGVRRDVVREVSDQDYTIRQDDVIELYFTGSCRILYAASRYPTPGETIVLRDEEMTEHTVLVWAQDGSGLETPSQGEVLASADSACLLRVSAKSPVLEKELLHRVYPAWDGQSSLMAIDLMDLTQFLRNLPQVWAAAVLMAVGLAWFFWAWGRKRGGLLALPFLTPLGVWLLLRGCALPGSLLPDANILDFTHYGNLLDTLRQNSLAPALEALLQTSLRQAKTQCAVFSAVGVFLILLPVLTVFPGFFRKKK